MNLRNTRSDSVAREAAAASAALVAAGAAAATNTAPLASSTLAGASSGAATVDAVRRTAAVPKRQGGVLVSKTSKRIAAVSGGGSVLVVEGGVKMNARGKKKGGCVGTRGGRGRGSAVSKRSTKVGSSEGFVAKSGLAEGLVASADTEYKPSRAPMPSVQIEPQPDVFLTPRKERGILGEKHRCMGKDRMWKILSVTARGA